MPRQEKKEHVLCDSRCRYAEYYDMQGTFDSLYAKSRNGEIFTSLMPLILSKENIGLAFRSIKTNKGSHTPGTDGRTIEDIGRLTPDEVVRKVHALLNGTNQEYTPLPVRRKDVPKTYDKTKTRPLGIPCLWDRLVQQCVKQILEPICEAKFSKNSYGFRPNRSAENAIAAQDNRIWHSKMWWVIEFDIKSFFDNVCHSKLIKQLWTLGIRDTKLLRIIRNMLKAPILMPDGSYVYPERGTPQGGILSPLLANVVLNELDWWIASQWENHPVVDKYVKGKQCFPNKGFAYEVMRKTRLKEMYIVRYADDFRVYCKTKGQAERTRIATTKWLADRLRLEVSQEKTRIVNVRSRYTDFLGIKMKVKRKGGKLVIISHVSDRTLKQREEKLTGQAKRIAKPDKCSNVHRETKIYNGMVVGMQNYYCMATRISADFRKSNRRVMTILSTRLKTAKDKGKLVKTGRNLTKFEKERFGKSNMLRYIASTEDPVYPIGFVRFRTPRKSPSGLSCFTAKGRTWIHQNLRIDTALMHALMRSPPPGLCLSAADCCISHFSAQRGKCAVSGTEFASIDEIACLHVNPNLTRGRERYANLILVSNSIRDLIYALEPSLISHLKEKLNLDTAQMKKLNFLRSLAGAPAV